MKNFIFYVLFLISTPSFSENCPSLGNVYDDLSCVNQNLATIKKKLNAVYDKIYLATEHKKEFEISQKAWLNYKEKQCSGYIAEEASQAQGMGSSLIVKDCFLTLTKQRLEYLNGLVENN